MGDTYNDNADTKLRFRGDNLHNRDDSVTFVVYVGDAGIGGASREAGNTEEDKYNAEAIRRLEQAKKKAEDIAVQTEMRTKWGLKLVGSEHKGAIAAHFAAMGQMELCEELIGILKEE